MKPFLRRFAGLVLGILSGLDRLVCRGKLCQLYSPDGMDVYLSANKILYKDFDAHAEQVTQRVLRASLMDRAKASDQFRYLASTNIDKDQVAREFAVKHRVKEGLVCVLQCVEPCWSFELQSKVVKGAKLLHVQGKQRKCSHLYHYFIDPQFGWMYVRLQTWFPFEMQVYVNGREWLSRRLDKEKLRYQRGDNKILWVEDWPRAQELFDEMLHTNWPSVLDAWQRQVHPLHPGHLGRLPLQYNWTTYQSEWATDVAFASRAELERWLPLWQRQAMDYNSSEILRFFGRAQLVHGDTVPKVETDWKRFFEGLRIKHWVNSNSLKLYDYLNVARVETTINDGKYFKVYRASQTEPEGPKDWRILRRTVADLYRRAEVSQAVNERYLAGMATVKETRAVKELVEPLCRRVPEPSKKAKPEQQPNERKPPRKVRALNPWSKEDAVLLTAINDPKWMVAGIRNRDLAAVLYPTAAADAQEKKRRSARVTRLLRLLRAHGLLHKVAKTHRYQISEKARTIIASLLAAGNANTMELMNQAA